jgi:hypothetical protein
MHTRARSQTYRQPTGAPHTTGRARACVRLAWLCPQRARGAVAARGALPDLALVSVGETRQHHRQPRNGHPGEGGKHGRVHLLGGEIVPSLSSHGGGGGGESWQLRALRLLRAMWQPAHVSQPASRPAGQPASQQPQPAAIILPEETGHCTHSIEGWVALWRSRGIVRGPHSQNKTKQNTRGSQSLLSLGWPVTK